MSCRDLTKILNGDCLPNRIIQSSKCSSGFLGISPGSSSIINVYYRKYETHNGIANINFVTQYGDLQHDTISFNKLIICRLCDVLSHRAAASESPPFLPLTRISASVIRKLARLRSDRRNSVSLVELGDLTPATFRINNRYNN